MPLALADRLRRDGFARIVDAVGVGAEFVLVVHHQHQLIISQRGIGPRATPHNDETAVGLHRHGWPKWLAITVAMLSADATPGEVRRMLEKGADHYLTKPFKPDELVLFLRRALVAEGDRAALAGGELLSYYRDRASVGLAGLDLHLHDRQPVDMGRPPPALLATPRTRSVRSRVAA